MREGLVLAFAVAFLAHAGGVAHAAGKPPAAVAPIVTVRVAPESVVHKDEVVLADIAAVEGDEPLASRVRTLRLGPAPVPGGQHRLDADALRLRLRQPQIDLTRVRLVVPDRVVVSRAYQVLPGAALVEAVSRQAMARLQEIEPPGSLSGPYALTPVTRPSDLRLPTGDVELAARLGDLAAPVTFVSGTVAVRVNGREYQSVPLNFRVGRLQPVVIATRPLEPRTVLAPSDFRVESRPSTEVPFDALAELTSPADMEPVGIIRAGDVVTQRQLRPKLVVRRGQTVTLLLESGQFRITAQGLARDDARRGDPVRVMNPTSQREVLGRVEGPGVVRVIHGSNR